MPRMFSMLALVAAMAAGWSHPGPTLAADSKTTHGKSTADTTKKKEKPAWDALPVDTCPLGERKPSIHCSATISGEFDEQGRLWLAWTNDGRVYVNHTDDLGRSFSPPVAVNAAPQSVDNNGENRPKLAMGPAGEIYLTYTIHAKQRFTGDVFFSRSLDGGKSFMEPISINDRPDLKSSLRFETLDVTRDGRVFVIWLDKRDLFAAKAAKTPYAGSAIYYAVSDDRGASFAGNTLLAHHTCECCRVAIDMEDGQRPIVAWRHVYDGMRDHAVARFTDAGTPEQPIRLSVDNWAIDGCPHHGPSLSIDGENRVHATWYTDGENRKGPFYARSTDGGRTFGHITPIGTGGSQAEHPFVLAAGRTVHVAWKDFHGDRSRFRVMSSDDGGESWNPGRTVLDTTEASDHPLLVRHADTVYALWRTAEHGVRVTSLREE